jgi:predicted transposase YbfD/YdcC
MAALASVATVKQYFRKLKDPRVVGRARHRLIDIILIAICGVIADCDDWHDIELFAKNRLAWFNRFLALPEGVPSHDTFERVFAQLDPRVFMQCCVQWLRAVAELLDAGQIAIDGKTLCGSASSKLRPLHLVSAWATQAKLTLGEVAVDGKSNEITAIPKLLELLDLKGALVTIDAIGCQKAIAEKIVAGGGDYLLAVKGNQEHLLEDIQTTMNQALDGDLPAHQVTTITMSSKGHGRREQRTCTAVTNLESVRDRAGWIGLKTLILCCRERTVNGQETMEAHYFISSRRMATRKFAEALRGHWGIENGLHWQLDVSFDEDASRIQQRNAAENFAFMRKLALCLLKQHSAKLSMARKRKAAAWDPDFLAATLMGAAKAAKV